MSTSGWAVVGLDTGGTAINATVLDADGRFLVDGLVETPSRVHDGPAVAVAALVEAMEAVLQSTGTARESVRAVGLDTPGPASAEGVISSKGATNFSDPEWHRFDVRGALQDRIGVPVVYNNDGNAAALYAHHRHFGNCANERSSASIIVGTGLGGGIIESGRVISGAAGMAGELGHVHIPMTGLLEPDQPTPRCNCGFEADGESVASLSGIINNLLPYWLIRYPEHPLHGMSITEAAKRVRRYGERADEMARKLFAQQATAIGRVFTIIANVLDPDTYFVGGGIVEAEQEFRDWFMSVVKENTVLRAEQVGVAALAVVPDLDMAGARGSAIAAAAAPVV
ncbi:MAG: ROK family protein [Mycobacteriales bacterium]